MRVNNQLRDEIYQALRSNMGGFSLDKQDSFYSQVGSTLTYSAKVNHELLGLSEAEAKTDTGMKAALLYNMATQIAATAGSDRGVATQIANDYINILAGDDNRAKKQAIIELSRMDSSGIMYVRNAATGAKVRNELGWNTDIGGSWAQFFARATRDTSLVNFVVSAIQEEGWGKTPFGKNYKQSALLEQLTYAQEEDQFMSKGWRKAASVAGFVTPIAESMLIAKVTGQAGTIVNSVLKGMYGDYALSTGTAERLNAERLVAGMIYDYITTAVGVGTNPVIVEKLTGINAYSAKLLGDMFAKGAAPKAVLSALRKEAMMPILNLGVNTLADMFIDYGMYTVGNAMGIDFSASKDQSYNLIRAIEDGKEQDVLSGRRRSSAEILAATLSRSLAMRMGTSMGSSLANNVISKARGLRDTRVFSPKWFDDNAKHFDDTARQYRSAYGFAKMAAIATYKAYPGSLAGMENILASSPGSRGKVANMVDFVRNFGTDKKALSHATAALFITNEVATNFIFRAVGGSTNKGQVSTNAFGRALARGIDPDAFAVFEAAINNHFDPSRLTPLSDVDMFEIKKGSIDDLSANLSGYIKKGSSIDDKIARAKVVIAFMQQHLKGMSADESSKLIREIVVTTDLNNVPAKTANELKDAIKNPNQNAVDSNVFNEIYADIKDNVSSIAHKIFADEADFIYKFSDTIHRINNAKGSADILKGLGGVQDGETLFTFMARNLGYSDKGLKLFQNIIGDIANLALTKTKGVSDEKDMDRVFDIASNVRHSAATLLKAKVDVIQAAINNPNLSANQRAIITADSLSYIESLMTVIGHRLSPVEYGKIFDPKQIRAISEHFKGSQSDIANLMLKVYREHGYEGKAEDFSHVAHAFNAIQAKWRSDNELKASMVRALLVSDSLRGSDVKDGDMVQDSYKASIRDKVINSVSPNVKIGAKQEIYLNGNKLSIAALEEYSVLGIVIEATQSKSRTKGTTQVTSHNEFMDNVTGLALTKFADTQWVIQAKKDPSADTKTILARINEEMRKKFMGLISLDVKNSSIDSYKFEIEPNKLNSQDLYSVMLESLTSQSHVRISSVSDVTKHDLLGEDGNSLFNKYTEVGNRENVVGAFASLFDKMLGASEAARAILSLVKDADTAVDMFRDWVKKNPTANTELITAAHNKSVVRAFLYNEHLKESYTSAISYKAMETLEAFNVLDNINYVFSNNKMTLFSVGNVQDKAQALEINDKLSKVPGMYHLPASGTNVEDGNWVYIPFYETDTSGKVNARAIIEAFKSVAFDRLKADLFINSEKDFAISVRTNTVRQYFESQYSTSIEVDKAMAIYENSFAFKAYKDLVAIQESISNQGVESVDYNKLVSDVADKLVLNAEASYSGSLKMLRDSGAEGDIKKLKSNRQAIANRLISFLDEFMAPEYTMNIDVQKSIDRIKDEINKAGDRLGDQLKADLLGVAESLLSKINNTEGGPMTGAIKNSNLLSAILEIKGRIGESNKSIGLMMAIKDIEDQLSSHEDIRVYSNIKQLLTHIGKGDAQAIEMSSSVLKEFEDWIGKHASSLGQDEYVKRLEFLYLLNDMLENPDISPKLFDKIANFSLFKDSDVNVQTFKDVIKGRDLKQGVPMLLSALSSNGLSIADPSYKGIKRTSSFMLMGSSDTQATKAQFDALSQLNNGKIDVVLVDVNTLTDNYKADRYDGSIMMSPNTFKAQSAGLGSASTATKQAWNLFGGLVKANVTPATTYFNGFQNVPIEDGTIIIPIANLKSIQANSLSDFTLGGQGTNTISRTFDLNNAFDRDRARALFNNGVAIHAYIQQGSITGLHSSQQVGANPASAWLFKAIDNSSTFDLANVFVKMYGENDGLSNDSQILRKVAAAVRRSAEYSGDYETIANFVPSDIDANVRDGVSVRMFDKGSIGAFDLSKVDRIYTTVSQSSLVLAKAAFGHADKTKKSLPDNVLKAAQRILEDTYTDIEAFKSDATLLMDYLSGDGVGILHRVAYAEEEYMYFTMPQRSSHDGSMHHMPVAIEEVRRASHGDHLGIDDILSKWQNADFDGDAVTNKQQPEPFWRYISKGLAGLGENTISKTEFEKDPLKYIGRFHGLLHESEVDIRRNTYVDKFIKLAVHAQSGTGATGGVSMKALFAILHASSMLANINKGLEITTREMKVDEFDMSQVKEGQTGNVDLRVEKKLRLVRNNSRVAFTANTVNRYSIFDGDIEKPTSASNAGSGLTSLSNHTMALPGSNNNVLMRVYRTDQRGDGYVLTIEGNSKLMIGSRLLGYTVVKTLNEVNNLMNTLKQSARSTDSEISRVVSAHTEGEESIKDNLSVLGELGFKMFADVTTKRIGSAMGMLMQSSTAFVDNLGTGFSSYLNKHARSVADVGSLVDGAFTEVIAGASLKTGVIVTDRKKYDIGSLSYQRSESNLLATEDVKALMAHFNLGIAELKSKFESADIDYGELRAENERNRDLFERDKESIKKSISNYAEIYTKANKLIYGDLVLAKYETDIKPISDFLAKLTDQEAAGLPPELKMLNTFIHTVKSSEGNNYFTPTSAYFDILKGDDYRSIRSAMIQSNDLQEDPLRVFSKEWRKRIFNAVKLVEAHRFMEDMMPNLPVKDRIKSINTIANDYIFLQDAIVDDRSLVQSMISAIERRTPSEARAITSMPVISKVLDLMDVHVSQDPKSFSVKIVKDLNPFATNGEQLNDIFGRNYLLVDSKGEPITPFQLRAKAVKLMTETTSSYLKTKYKHVIAALMDTMQDNQRIVTEFLSNNYKAEMFRAISTIYNDEGSPNRNVDLNEVIKHLDNDLMMEVNPDNNILPSGYKVNIGVC